MFIVTDTARQAGSGASTDAVMERDREKAMHPNPLTRQEISPKTPTENRREYFSRGSIVRVR